MYSYVAVCMYVCSCSSTPFVGACGDDRDGIREDRICTRTEKAAIAAAIVKPVLTNFTTRLPLQPLLQTATKLLHLLFQLIPKLLHLLFQLIPKLLYLLYQLLQNCYKKLLLQDSSCKCIHHLQQDLRILWEPKNAIESFSD